MTNKKLIHCDELQSHIRIENGKVITPLEEEIDIFSTTKKTVVAWEPKTKLTPYEQLKKVYLDIETDLIPEVNGKKVSTEEAARQGRVRLIGLKSETGKEIIIGNTSEYKMLCQLRDILEQKKPDLLLTFNGTIFDLVYLYFRFEILKIDRNPFKIAEHTTNFRAARLAGRPWDVEFKAVYVNILGHRVDHIDLYQLAIAYDSVIRKFNVFSLKSLPIEMGLREIPRLELSPLQMQQAYDNCEYGNMIQYLKYDLEDTQLLADALMPSLYYQRIYFPRLTLQQLVTSGNATKWLTLLEDYYGKTFTNKIVRGDSAKFKGAITRAVAGIHRWVAAFDFSAQYPSCMKQYGINSENDPDGVMLAAMQHAVNYRGEIKYKKDPSKLEQDLSTAVKPVINSAYGSLASIIPYGDTVAAATVTLMARARIKWAIAFVESLGGEIVLSDTDSLYIKTNKTDLHLKYTLSEEILSQLPKDAPDQLLSAVAIGEELKKKIPSGSLLDFDGAMEILFVPPSTSPRDYDKKYTLGSNLGRQFAYKHLLVNYEQVGNLGQAEQSIKELDKELIDREISNYGHEKVTYSLLKTISDKHFLDFPNYEAIKKNYIKKIWDNKKQAYILKAKGKYVKRDRCQLEKDFQKNYISKLVKSKREADDYYYNLLAELYSREYDVDKLKITRVIRVNEINLVKLGIGKIHERVSYYIGTGDQPCISGQYSVTHYADKIKKMYEEMTCFIELTNRNDQDFEELLNLQMSLF